MAFCGEIVYICTAEILYTILDVVKFNNKNKTIKIMKKYLNVLCVLILAVMLIDLLVGFFYTGSQSVVITVDLDSYSLTSLLILLFFMLLALAAIVVCMVSFIKFILNVNRNEVFSRKNISLLRKYGVCALLVGVFIIIINIVLNIDIKEVMSDGLDAICEGFFALLMGEVFGIGMNLQEGKNPAA